MSPRASHRLQADATAQTGSRARASVVRIAATIALPALACVALGGCVTSAVTQVAGMPTNVSHRPDRAVSAYRLPDGNLVIFVDGRMRGVRGESSFSMLVPRDALDRLKEQSAHRRHTDNYFRVWYDAPIGPSIAHRLDGWTEIPIERVGSRLDSYALANLPAGTAPLLYEVPEDKGLGEHWGRVNVLYVERYSDGAPFRVEINPQVTRVKGNAAKWLPLTVPADIVSLPAQALWGALFLMQAAPAAGDGQ